jgi:hypothetical protein
MIAKNVVSAGVKAATGMELSMESINLGITKPEIGIKKLKLFNPSGFEDKVMADMPEIYVDYNAKAFLKRNIHLRKLKMHLKEFVVVRNEGGGLNIDSLTAIREKKTKAPPQKKKSAGPAFKIDVMELKIDKVIFRDYAKGILPKRMEFVVSINERYENITDPRTLTRLIVLKALMNTTVAKLTDFNIESLKTGIPDILERTRMLPKETADRALEAGKKIRQKTEETIEKTTDMLKKVLE